MGDSLGRQLQSLIQRELVHSLHDAAAALPAGLAALGPDESIDSMRERLCGRGVAGPGSPRGGRPAKGRGDGSE
jgi:hypothetical protein